MQHRNLTRDTGFRVLSPTKCQRIHEASLEILERTGMRVLEGEAVKLLADAGADVTDGNQVRFPTHLVEDALRSAPSRITLYDRNKGPVMRLADRNVHFGTGSDCPFILDSRTGERRKFLKADVEEAIRLCDAAPNIDFVLSVGLISDVPTAVSDIHQFEAMIAQTTKPVVFTAHNVENCRLMLEMNEIVAGGATEAHRYPHIVFFSESLPPLQYDTDATRNILACAEKDVPIVLSAGPMMGASGPQTHAGVLALANAEILAGTVMTQLKHVGAPVIYGIGVHPLDMRTTVLAYGAPELWLNIAASTDMARFYGMPVWGYAGCTDAKIVDEQAAAEATLSVVMSLLSGNHLIHDVGYLESGLVSSFEMILLTDMLIEMSRASLKEVEIDDETLPLDLIHKVGPGGNYLVEDHTYRHFREVWYSNLIDRQKREEWEAAGRPTLGGRLKGKVLDILTHHTPEPLADDIRKELALIIESAEKTP